MASGKCQEKKCFNFQNPEEKCRRKKTNKKLEIAKTEPESEGDELLGSDGETFK